MFMKTVVQHVSSSACKQRAAHASWDSREAGCRSLFKGGGGQNINSFACLYISRDLNTHRKICPGHISPQNNKK